MASWSPVPSRPRPVPARAIGIVGYHAQRVTFTVIGDDRLFADDFE